MARTAVREGRRTAVREGRRMAASTVKARHPRSAVRTAAPGMSSAPGRRERSPGRVWGTADRTHGADGALPVAGIPDPALEVPDPALDVALPAAGIPGPALGRRPDPATGRAHRVAGGTADRAAGVVCTADPASGLTPATPIPPGRAARTSHPASPVGLWRAVPPEARTTGSPDLRHPAGRPTWRAEVRLTDSEEAGAAPPSVRMGPVRIRSVPIATVPMPTVPRGSVPMASVRSRPAPWRNPRPGPRSAGGSAGSVPRRRRSRVARRGRTARDRARWYSRSLPGGRGGTGHHSGSPEAVKYHRAELNQTTTSTVVSNPPSTGSVHPGSPAIRSDSILAANTP